MQLRHRTNTPVPPPGGSGRPARVLAGVLRAATGAVSWVSLRAARSSRSAQFQRLTQTHLAEVGAVAQRSVVRGPAFCTRWRRRSRRTQWAGAGSTQCREQCTTARGTHRGWRCWADHEGGTEAQTTDGSLPGCHRRAPSRYTAALAGSGHTAHRGGGRAGCQHPCRRLALH